MNSYREADCEFANMQCPICCDDIVENTSNIVKCHFCSYETCVPCAQQYLLQTIETAHCMNCRKGWTREFMLEQFSKKFVLTEYKEHRENVLFDKEKSLLPASQPYAERELQARAKRNEVNKIVEEKKQALQMFREDHRGYAFVATALEKITEEISKVLPHTYARYYQPSPLLYLEHHQRMKICDYPCTGNLVNGSCTVCFAKTCDDCGHKYFPRPSRMNIEQHICRDENIAREKKRKELLTTYRELMNTEDALEYMCLQPQVDLLMRRYDRDIAKKRREMRATPGGMGITIPSLEREKRTFVRPCPANDCRGFLSTAWKCGICENFTCPHCHEVKGKSRDAPHVCLQENVETAKLLAKDTKPCPNCGIRIFKISGCSQMWCTECHTAFCWSTGEIERGNIHNPHYYEFMRRNQGRDGRQQREIRDIPCGGLPDYMELLSKFKKLLRSDEYIILEPYHRLIGEVMDLRTWYRRRNLEDKREIRVKYLLKDYDDAQFKRHLQMKAKAQEKVTNIDQVLDMFVMASTAILQRVRDIKTRDEGLDIITELEELRKYMNASMEKVSYVYDCKTPHIDEGYDLHRVGERKQW